MPRRERPNPAATYGWEGEVRQENIDSAVGSYLRAHGPRTYREAHDTAKRLAGAGKQPDEICETLRRAPRIHEYSAEDSLEWADQKEIDNSVERYLCDAARQGIEDALAGRAPNYKSPPGY